MSRPKEQSAKRQHNRVAKWLRKLQSGQIRALSHQYHVDNAMTEDIERLRTDLLMIPAVCKLAGELDGQGIQTQ